MKKRTRILLTCFAAAIVAGLVWLGITSREPSYQGKPLAFWLEQFGTNQWRHQTNDLHIQAQAAIQHIGTGVVPTCLRMMNAKESRLRLKLTSLLSRRWRERLNVPHNFVYQNKVRFQRELGGVGFVALGSEAAPFIPEIEKLLRDKNPGIRVDAVVALGELGPMASNSVPSLIDCLRDPDPDVILNAFRSLGQIHQRPDLVVPIVNSYVDSKNISLQIPGLLALEQFGPAAKSAVPHLLPLLNHASGYVRFLATNDLLIIDPDAAAKAGIKPP